MVKSVLAVMLTLLFVIGLYAGLNTPPELKKFFLNTLIKELSPLKEVVSKGSLTSFILLAFLIFLNNLRVALLNVFLGFTLIIPPLIVLVNGYVIGLVISEGDVLRNLVLIIPHGVIEIPAVLYSAVLGTYLGVETFRKYLMRRDVSLTKDLTYVLKKFVVVVVLLIVAAFIEVFITPTIHYFLK